VTRVLLYTGKGGVGKTTSAAGTATLAALRGLRTLVLSMLPVGIGFGAMEVALPAFADHEGRREVAGLLIAVWSVGSVIGGLVYGMRPRRSSLADAHLRIAAAVPLGLAPVLLATSTATMAILVVPAGAFIAPLIASRNELAGRLAEPCAAWLAEESKLFGRCLLLCEALPPAEQYCAMMDGRWVERGWMFSLGEAASPGVFLWGIHVSKFDCSENPDRFTCDQHGLLRVGGALGFLAFRAWDIADAFVARQQGVAADDDHALRVDVEALEQAQHGHRSRHFHLPPWVAQQHLHAR